MKPFDFHDLKTVSVANGEVTLRIPRHWGVFPHESQVGCWGCYEEGDDNSGTLWIQVDHFDGPEGQTPTDSLVDKDFVEPIIENMKGNLPPLLENSTTRVDQGYRWFRVYDTEENGEPLRFWFSHFFLGCGNHNAVISFNFVLTHEQMNDPDYVELPDIMEREISAAFLDPFCVYDEREAEKVLGPLIRYNFDDQAKLVLPEAMGCRPHEDGGTENQWYCRLTTDSSHAGMFVYVDDFEFAREEGESGTEEKIEDENRLAQQMFESIFQEILSERADTPDGDQSARRTPWGAVFYDIIDDDDGGEEAATGETGSDDEDGQLRTHLFQALCHKQFEQRRLQVLLMIPVSETDKPPYPQLLAYVRRAVCRAEFPGFQDIEVH